ncbi:hypothetical protein [Streptomyces hainanensis]|uniref:Uncharacterized protein n=1 Tax=Streptomyces hainanensis TaxID=402648 RepID=A0A4R4TE22_9ACTN|nr:hypothetical protein [Streptomyces hainanensis]TDC75617.1 hypothetical protein E1283_11835 [Streptomyces hainanensis]
MLSLRLARGAHPAALCRRLLVACAAGGVGFLLLSALAYAVAHPGGGRESLLRLGWCVVPLAATVQLSMTVARVDPAGRPGSGLDMAGLGPGRMPLLAAVSTAFAGVLGSVLGLLLFLHLRGDTSDLLPYHGAAAEVLPAGRLPLGAALTLLTLVPLTAAVATALALKRAPARRARASQPMLPPDALDVADAARAEPPVPLPAGLPWGTALTTAGIALSAYAGVDRPKATDDGLLPLGGTLGGVPPGVVGGWLLITAGIVLAAPGLVHLCGLLLAVGRPRVVRLLAARGLQEESRRVGRPLGVLCAAAAASLAALSLDGLGRFGPLGVLGTGIVLVCSLAAVATAADEARAARRPATALLRRLGAPRGMLFRAALLRIGVLLVGFVPLTWLAAQLIALPAGG